MEKQKKLALVLDNEDNVATLLTNGFENDIITLKGIEGKLQIFEDIELGHKAALKHISNGEAVVKYGHRIGVATKNIQPGEWVHLHNMQSVVDPIFRKRIEP